MREELVRKYERGRKRDGLLCVSKQRTFPHLRRLPPPTKNYPQVRRSLGVLQSWSPAGQKKKKHPRRDNDIPNLELPWPENACFCWLNHHGMCAQIIGHCFQLRFCHTNCMSDVRVLSLCLCFTFLCQSSSLSACAALFIDVSCSVLHHASVCMSLSPPLLFAH